LESRRLRNEELYDLYPSQNILRMIKTRKEGWGMSHYAGEERYCTCTVLVVKTEEEILLVRPRYRWENNIKMYRREVG